MMFRVLCILFILAGCSKASEGLPFEDFGLASVAEYEVPEDQLRRDKRTLTTICVEIKPSSPYEEPYFMCKGTDSPKYSKGSSSDSYSDKPSYKPSKPSTYASGESGSYHSEVKKINDYHTPAKPEYHIEHSNYAKPTSDYDSGKEYSTPSKQGYDKKPSYDDHGIHHGNSYSNYKPPTKPTSYSSAKPVYAEYHDSHDDYGKTHYAHKVTNEKPSAPAYSSKPQSYSEGSSAYDHRQTAGYSKPSSYDIHSTPGGYSKPSSSYEQTEYLKPSSHASSSSSYNEESHSKPSYGGHDDQSYSTPPETKVLYSKPTSYPAKQITYEHADNAQYGQSKPSYSEHPSSKPYSKPTQDYAKPAPSYSSHEQHAGYAPQTQSYRMMPQDLMKPAWDFQPQQLQYDGPGYRSYGAAMEYQNFETPRAMNYESQISTGLEGPTKFDLSDADQQGPALQLPYQYQTHTSSAQHSQMPASYGPFISSYPQAVHYAPPAPSYTVPTYPTVAPSYAPLAPASYAPLPTQTPPYASPVESYTPLPSSHGSPLPVCKQNYMYSYQPVVMSVPCYTFSGGYVSSTYAQPLGSPSNQQNVNPIKDHSGARSEGKSESNTKSPEDHSASEESHESHTKSESEIENVQIAEKKSDHSGIVEEKHHQQVDKKSQDQVVGAAEKPIANSETQNTQTVTAQLPKNPEGPHTKEAYNAMMKMARIAAQLNKDDANKGTTAEGLSAVSGTVQVNGKSAEPLQQFSHSK